ncbi:MAG TPA: hypothetical protein VG294_02480 [Solirubrobacteraceae bacterium]|nr:hypothetical protein [Solirubrobacteraceae bacterium]
MVLVPFRNGRPPTPLKLIAGVGLAVALRGWRVLLTADGDRVRVSWLSGLVVVRAVGAMMTSRARSATGRRRWCRRAVAARGGGGPGAREAGTRAAGLPGGGGPGARWRAVAVAAAPALPRVNLATRVTRV